MGRVLYCYNGCSNSHAVQRVMNQPHAQLSPDAADLPRLASRIEEASLNAWPALQQTFMDGWVLRFSRGFTKRSNSIVPLYPSRARASLAEKIRYCENLYAREQLQTVFRLTSIPDDGAVATLDAELEQRGYELADTSLVLSAPLGLSETGAQTAIELLPLESWLSVYCTLTGMPEPARSLHGLILNSIAGECGFGVVRVDGEPVACGLGVVERELIGLFDIYTSDTHRGSGYGKTMVAGLLDWARDQGAERAYLQMVEDNAPAKALYERLGFEEIYRYWYRVSP